MPSSTSLGSTKTSICLEWTRRVMRARETMMTLMMNQVTRRREERDPSREPEAHPQLVRALESNSKNANSNDHKI